MFIYVLCCIRVYVWISGIRVVYSFYIFLYMSPTRSEYKELGLKLVETFQHHPLKPRRPSMVEENKDEGARYHFPILLKEYLKR